MTTTPNDRLRAARGAARLTQAQVAELANAQVEASTGRPGAMDADYVGKLERGVHRWPNRDYRDALRVVLRADSDADLGFAGSRPRPATVEANPRYREGGDDVERQAFLRVLAGSVAGLGLSDPLAEFAARTAGGSDRRVGRADVEHIRGLARLFAGQDHQYGGALSSRAVLAQLSASAELTEGTFADDHVRADLFSAVAELADTAAGICFDAGLHSHAERAFRYGVGCATESGDWAMRAKALSGLANLAVHQRRPDAALSYAELALVRADRLGHTVAAVIHTRHARALGLAGPTRERDCRTAIATAEDHFAAATPGDHPAWLAHYGPAHLHRDSGRALLNLALTGGSPDQARHHLDTAIAAFPPGHSRGKALAQANLATLTMTHDDPAHAATLAHTTLDSVASIRSDRVNDALRQLATAARTHPTRPAAHDLAHRIEQTLTTQHAT